jgi:hypothetical protein
MSYQNIFEAVIIQSRFNSTENYCRSESKEQKKEEQCGFLGKRKHLFEYPLCRSSDLN